jgi:hypothetical protein
MIDIDLALLLVIRISITKRLRLCVFKFLFQLVPIFDFYIGMWKIQNDRLLIHSARVVDYTDEPRPIVLLTGVWTKPTIIDPLKTLNHVFNGQSLLFGSSCFEGFNQSLCIGLFHCVYVFSVLVYDPHGRCTSDSIMMLEHAINSFEILDYISMSSVEAFIPSHLDCIQIF